MPLFSRPVDEREAVLPSQVNIQKNHVRHGFRGDTYETFFQSLRKDCFVAFGFKPVLEELSKLGIVLHHENPLPHSVSFRRHRAAVVESRAQKRHTFTVILSSYRNKS